MQFCKATIQTGDPQYWKPLHLAHFLLALLFAKALSWVQIPGQPKGHASWWGPKDDRALLQGYHQEGGIPWNTKAFTAAVDAILSNSSLEFSVKVSGFRLLSLLLLLVSIYQQPAITPAQASMLL